MFTVLIIERKELRFFSMAFDNFWYALFIPDTIKRIGYPAGVHKVNRKVWTYSGGQSHRILLFVGHSHSDGVIEFLVS